jgi:hypothetical protein
LELVNEGIENTRRKRKKGKITKRGTKERESRKGK